MIKIVCVGKIKEKYLVDAFAEYEKRMNIYHKIKVVELKESNNKDLKHNLEEEGNAMSVKRDSPPLRCLNPFRYSSIKRTAKQSFLTARSCLRVC